MPAISSCRSSIFLFDDNGISIDGPTSLSDSVDQVARFKSAGWNASRIDGQDPDAVARAIDEALTSDRPTMIACRTIIGYGAPTKAGTSKAHGEALGAEELAGAKKALGWDYGRSRFPRRSSATGAPPVRAAAPPREAWREALRRQPDAARGEFERRHGAQAAGGARQGDRRR